MSKAKTTKLLFRQINGQLLSMEADLDFMLRQLYNLKISLGDDLRDLPTILADYAVTNAFIVGAHKRIEAFREHLTTERYK